jgi:PelA/Pel-15E family pectate lyase
MASIMSLKNILFVLCLCGMARLVPASITGTNVSSQALTSGRIAGLPQSRQSEWQSYLDRSVRQHLADEAFLQAELKAHGIKEPADPAPAKSTESLGMSRAAEWYGQEEGRRIADIIVSYQLPSGGWGKNMDMTRQKRAPGERFVVGTSFVGTFDNNATITQMRFLAKVITASDAGRSESCRKAFDRGFGYILASQYPNGGWPQVWPLEGGYHDGITYNDGAMVNVLRLLREMADGKEEFAFVPADKRQAAVASFDRGIDCILATQITVNGRRTVWCQQHDPLTGQPASARNYEMPSLCSSESAGILMLLMQLPDPGPRVVDAVHAAAAWFEKTRLKDVAFKSTGTEGRLLVPAPGSGPLWARYYEIGTDRPIFGDRDKTIHDDVSEISRERRNGYAWFGNNPKRVLQHYAGWSKTHEPQKSSTTADAVR